MSETKNNINSLNLEKVTAILVDVAGTTTAINFVEETLSPYISKNVEEFLKNQWEEEDVKTAVSKLEEKDLDATKAAEIVKTLTEKNDANIGLKNIQGLLHKKGYENGELKGHVFPDVPKCLELWSKSRKIAVFSTGSIESQQLLFKNSIEGDLSSYITKYFDQTVGLKTEADSYKKIAEEMETVPQNILFLTDDIKEAEAAQSAALNVVLVEREGNIKITEESLVKFPAIKSFDEILLENIKRKIEEETLEEPPTKVAKTEEKTASKGDADFTEPEKEKLEESVKAAQAAENETAEKCDEAMEVDEKPDSTDKAKEENIEGNVEGPKDNETAKKETTEKSELENGETKTESMEVEERTETNTAPSVENEKCTLESKAETDIGTQTKTTTNEIETQTTISIRAAEEIPMKEVHDKLLESKTDEKVELEEKIIEKVESEEKTDGKVEPEGKSEVDKDKEPVKESTECVETKVENNVETKVENNVETKVENNVERCDAEVKSTEEPKTEVEKIEVEKVEVEGKKQEDIKTAEAKLVEKQDPSKVEEKSEKTEDIKEIEEESTVVLPKDNGEKAGEVKEEEKKEIQIEETKTGETKKTDDETETRETPAIAKENGVKADEIIEEKENKSELANGKENGIAKVETNDTVVVEQKDEEIKVKKIEEKIESAPVSVEA